MRPERLENLGDKSKLVRATLDLARWEGCSEQERGHDVYRVLTQHRECLSALLAGQGVSWVKRPVVWPQGMGLLTEAQAQVIEELISEVETMEALLAPLVEREAA